MLIAKVPTPQHEVVQRMSAVRGCGVVRKERWARGVGVCTRRLAWRTKGTVGFPAFPALSRPTFGQHDPTVTSLSSTRRLCPLILRINRQTTAPGPLVSSYSGDRSERALRRAGQSGS